MLLSECRTREEDWVDLVPRVTPMDIVRKNAFEFASFSFFF